MPNFIDDETGLDFPKSSTRITEPGREAFTLRASDWNKVCQALYDTRAKIHASGVFVWDLATSWATIYARMNAVPGPKLCLVQFDDATDRVMTNNGGVPTDLNEILLVGTSGVQGQADVHISVNDGFLLATKSVAGSTYAYLNSKNIQWAFDNSAPIASFVAGSGDECNINLEGGGLFGVGASPLVVGGLALFLSNRAFIIGDQYFRVTDNNAGVVMTGGSVITGTSVFIGDGGGPHLFSVLMDASCQITSAAINAALTLSVSCTNTAVNAAGVRFNISIDGGGNVIATAVP